VAHHGILVLLSLLMMSTERRTGSSFGRTIILIGVIACLCFSVGEGLRLRPFPVSALAKSEATNTQFNPTASYETSLCKYGPLGAPTQVQKRGKRQGADYVDQPSESARELAAHQVLLPDTGADVDIVSLLFGSRSTGRAPPFIS